jgi:hypothetical protein
MRPETRGATKLPGLRISRQRMNGAFTTGSSKQNRSAGHSDQACKNAVSGGCLQTLALNDC